jgi:hypothetical protein
VVVVVLLLLGALHRRLHMTLVYDALNALALAAFRSKRKKQSPQWSLYYALQRVTHLHEQQ